MTLLFVSAVFLRLLWVLAIDATPISDMRFYYDQGVSIARGTGYVSDGAVNGYYYPDYPAGAPTADRPIGYSAFLGLLFRLFGPSVTVAEIANVVLSAGALVLFYGAARRLTPDRATVRIAAGTLVFFPNQIAYCSLLSDSILFQFLIMAAFSLVLRSGRWPTVLSTGLVIGLATLTRAYAILLPALWGAILWRPFGWLGLGRRLALAGMAAVLVVSPWTVRNYQVFGDFALVSTNFGHNLLAGHNERSTGQWSAVLPAAAYEPGFRNEIERDHALRKMALQYALAHPLRTIAMSFRKMFYMYADDADGLRWNIKGHQATDVNSGTPKTGPGARYGLRAYAGMAFFEGYYLVVLLGFLGCVVVKLRGRLREFDSRGLGFWTVAYFTMVAIVFFGMSRFHYPVVPFLTLGAVAFYAHFWQSITGRRWVRRLRIARRPLQTQTSNSI